MDPDEQGSADSDEKRSDLGAVMDAYDRLLMIKNRG